MGKKIFKTIDEQIDILKKEDFFNKDELSQIDSLKEKGFFVVEVNSQQESGINRFFHSRKPVCTQQQDIFHAPVLQFV